MVCRGLGVELQQHESALSYLGLIDQHIQLCNLSPDLVLFADEVMDTLGKLFLVNENIRVKENEFAKI